MGGSISSSGGEFTIERGAVRNEKVFGHKYKYVFAILIHSLQLFLNCAYWFLRFFVIRLTPAEEQRLKEKKKQLSDIKNQTLKVRDKRVMSKMLAQEAIGGKKGLFRSREVISPQKSIDFIGDSKLICT